MKINVGLFTLILDNAEKKKLFLHYLLNQHVYTKSFSRCSTISNDDDDESSNKSRIKKTEWN